MESNRYFKIFSVFDSKAASFGVPFADHQEGSAIRNFADAVNDGSNPNNMWHNHPEDFSLFQLAEFDNNTGEIVPIKPKSLVTASALQTFKQPELKLDA
ncbi:nonstructural protein [Blackfly microvirus SF02]|uniref:Nonstructural protein n=1 Tax=Blackfly microvirus SF02 TaxID=2576452 RepID=A0A4P8PKC4_9VIRU|nr:nonstructural protein [Blackfly microvirus SF02]